MGAFAIFGGNRLFSRKTDFPFRPHLDLQQLLDGLEHHLEVLVVFFLHLLYFVPQLRVAGKHLALTGEGAHDLDVHLDGAPAAQDA